MTMHNPTEEQQAIISAARSTSDNILVNALAGAAKTTTLEMVCRAITGIPILSLAFNKRIADEMTKRLPSHVEARTMNSLGHRVWSQVIGRRLVVNTSKMAELLKLQIADLTPSGKEQAWDEYADTLRWLRFAKRDGYIPTRWRGLAKYDAGSLNEWLQRYDEEPSDQQLSLLDTVLNASIEAAYAGQIDYDDQIYMPVCFGASWPRFPLVLIDEFQDLNELQHEMLFNLAKSRLIGVGDPWQSIYAFRGAKQNGMAAARERWNMREFPLSISFRVPRTGVERAWFRVPHMRWRDNAPDGHVERLATWGQADVPDGAAIICRNNAPLFHCALQLLAQGRAIKLVGMDIGPNLIRLMKKLGPLEMTEEQIMRAIEGWQKSELAKAKREETVYEKADCLRVLCANRASLREAIRYTEDLFKRDGLVQLLSGHKAKGLEWETVFHLDPWRIPSRFAREGSEEWEQEMNVRYVVETRFKERLYLADMEGFV